MFAGLFNRILGFGLRIVLVRVMGDEGLGLFQRVFPIFITTAILVTIGLPVAISKFVSQETSRDNYAQALKALKISLGIVTITGLAATVLFTKQANLIANKILDDARTYHLVLAIAPALFFTSLASVFRGFFQGLRIMTPTACSQIIEQIARLLITLFLVFKLLNNSIKFKAMGATIGISFGEAMGLLTLIIIFFYYLPQLKRHSTSSKLPSSKSLIKQLLAFGIPITLGRLISSLMYTIEAVTIPNNLEQLGYSMSAATSFYGQLSGMVQQLIYLPTILTVALNSNLVPAISESITQNNKAQARQRANEAIRLTSYFGLLAVLVLFLLPKKICSLLFSHPQAGDTLRVIAVLGIFLYLSQIFAGILQGLGKPKLVVRNSIIGLTAELLLIQGIVYLPKQWGTLIISLAIGIRYLLIAGFHFLSINRKLTLQLPLFHLFGKPLLAGGLVWFLLPHSYNLFYYLSTSNLISLFSSIGFSSCVYLGVLIITGGITKEDFQRLTP